MSTELRPLSTGEVLDKTFSLYRAHFKLFVGIMAVPAVIPFALSTLAQLVPLLGPAAGVSTLTTTAAIIIAVALGVIFVLVYGLAYAMAQAATVYAVSEVYLGRQTTILRAFSQVRQFALRILWMLIVIFLATAAGFLLLIVPGILVALWYSMAIPAAVIENLKTSAALRRSESLTKGRRGGIFLLFLLFVVLNYVAAFMFGLPAALLMGLWPGVPSLILNNLATLVSGALVGPLLTIGLSLMYYDLRVRKEGFDLQVMMAGLAAENATPLSASPITGVQGA